jgi:lipopolysaccharide transport system permease protein
MKTHSLSPNEMIGSFWRNRGLIKALTKREVIGRYRGSLMGILWSFFNPLLMLAVYTFVFGVIFKSRWRAESNSTTEFTLILFSGLIVFNFFSECINKSPSLILSSVSYVKRVVFPLEVLPWVSVGSAGFHALVSISVWLAAYLILFGIPHISILFLPLVIIPLILFIIGLSWFLASLGVYLRDTAQFVGIFTMILMFLSPIFYPPSALPEGLFRDVLTLNPLTTIVEQVRDVMFWGNFPNFKKLIEVSFVGLITAWLGFIWFQKTRKGFADVI